MTAASCTAAVARRGEAPAVSRHVRERPWRGRRARARDNTGALPPSLPPSLASLPPPPLGCRRLTGATLRQPQTPARATIGGAWPRTRDAPAARPHSPPRSHTVRRQGTAAMVAWLVVDGLTPRSSSRFGLRDPCNPRDVLRQLLGSPRPYSARVPPDGKRCRPLAGVAQHACACACVTTRRTGPTCDARRTFAHTHHERNANIVKSRVVQPRFLYSKLRLRVDYFLSWGAPAKSIYPSGLPSHACGTLSSFSRSPGKMARQALHLPGVLCARAQLQRHVKAATQHGGALVWPYSARTRAC